MKLKTTLAAFAVLATVLAGLIAAPRVEAQTKRHSAAWYRAHSKKRHSAAWYRKHAPKRHSAAWYRSHRRK